MAQIWADRVMEVSATNGTGAFTLAGPYLGYRAFSAVCSVADTVYYSIEAIDGSGNPSGDWEVGFGTYSSANTLTRTTPVASSNGNAAVNFGSGSKRVMLAATAQQFARPLSSYEAAAVTIPVLSSFTWVNQGTSTAVDTTSKGILLNAQGDGYFHSLMMTPPSAPYDIYLRCDTFSGNSANTGYLQPALMLRNSTAGQGQGYALVLEEESGRGVIIGQRINNTYQGASSPIARRYSAAGKPLQWMRANITSTTITLYVSMDGETWISIGTETISTHILAVNQVGFGCRSNTNVGNAYMMVNQFGFTAP